MLTGQGTELVQSLFFLYILDSVIDVVLTELSIQPGVVVIIVVGQILKRNRRWGVLGSALLFAEPKQCELAFQILDFGILSFQIPFHITDRTMEIVEGKVAGKKSMLLDSNDSLLALSTYLVSV